MTKATSTKHKEQINLMELYDKGRSCGYFQYIQYISKTSQYIQYIFLTLRLTTFVWALCQSFWNKKSLNNNNFFQLEASMNLLNIFRKNKYYEQFCLKRLYKSHVIELTWRKANRANTGSLTIIFLTTWFKDGDL